MNDVGKAIIRVVRWVETMPLYETLTAVPRKHNISYVTHAWRNLKRSIALAYVAFCTGIHAFFPFWYTHLSVENNEFKESIEPVISHDTLETDRVKKESLKDDEVLKPLPTTS